MTSANLILFGRFQLVCDGRVAVIASRKSRALIAYLATQPDRAFSREKLADLLWGDRPDKQARQNLRQTLASLRQELPESLRACLVAEGEAISWRGGGVQVDALELGRLAGAGADTAELAAKLYRAPFLAEGEVGVEPFDDWLRAEREKYDRLAAGLLEMGARQLDSGGAGARAIALAERLVELDRWREDRQMLLLELLARHRGPRVALDAARGFAAELKRDAGVEPGPQFAAFAADLEAAARRKPELPVGPVAPATAQAGSGAATPPPDSRARPLWRRYGSAVALGALLALGTGAWMAMSPVERPVAGETKGEGVRVLILPFLAPSGQADEKRIADAITEELVTLLVRVPMMQVAPHHATLAYRDRPIDIAALARRHGAKFAVEGSLRSERDELRVSVRLVNLERQIQVWSKTFKAKPGAAGDLVLRVSRELQIAVFEADTARPEPGNPPDDTDALAERARKMYTRGLSREARAEQRALWEEVLRRRPGDSQAMMFLVATLMDGYFAFQWPDPEAAMDRAESLIESVLARGSVRSNAPHAYRGLIHKAKGEYRLALAASRRSVEINPGHASSYAQIGHLLVILGQAEEGLAAIGRALEISPNDPWRGNWLAFRADAFFALGRTAEGLATLREAIAAMPSNGALHLRLAGACLMAGETDCAEAHEREFRRLVDPAAIAQIRKRNEIRSAEAPERLWVNRGIARLLEHRSAR